MKPKESCQRIRKILLWWLIIERKFLAVGFFIRALLIKDLFHYFLRIFWVGWFRTWIWFLFALRRFFSRNLFGLLFIIDSLILHFLVLFIVRDKLLPCIIEHYILRLQVFHGDHIPADLLSVATLLNRATAYLRL